MDNHDRRVARLKIKAKVNVGLIALATNRTPREVLREMLREVSPDADWHDTQRNAFVDSYAACKWSSDSTVKDVVA